MQFRIYPQLPASDLDRGRGWYSEKLGLEPGILSVGVVFEDYDFGEGFRTVDGILMSPDGEKTSWFEDS